MKREMLGHSLYGNRSRKLKEDKNQFISENILPKIKELLESKYDDLPDYLMGGANVYEFVEILTDSGESYDGYMNFTDGAVKLHFPLPISFMVQCGYEFETPKMAEAVESMVSSSKEMTQDYFWVDHEDELIDAGFEDKYAVDYYSLTEKGLDDLAEYFEEEMYKYLNDDNATMEIRVSMFSGRQRSDHTEKEFQCEVSSVYLNEYGREIEDIYVNSFYYDSSEDVESIIERIDGMVDESIKNLEP